jgi:hypothetical protein
MTIKDMKASLHETETSLNNCGDMVKNLAIPLEQMHAALEGLKDALKEQETRNTTLTCKPNTGRESYIDRKKESCAFPPCNLPPDNEEHL